MYLTKHLCKLLFGANLITATGTKMLMKVRKDMQRIVIVALNNENSFQKYPSA